MNLVALNLKNTYYLTLCIYFELQFLGYPIATDFNYGGKMINRREILKPNDEIWKTFFTESLVEQCPSCKTLKLWLNEEIETKEYSIGKHI